MGLIAYGVGFSQTLSDAATHCNGNLCYNIIDNESLRLYQIVLKWIRNTKIHLSKRPTPIHSEIRKFIDIMRTGHSSSNLWPNHLGDNQKGFHSLMLVMLEAVRTFIDRFPSQRASSHHDRSPFLSFRWRWRESGCDLKYCLFCIISHSTTLTKFLTCSWVIE